MQRVPADRKGAARLRRRYGLVQGFQPGHGRHRELHRNDWREQDRVRPSLELHEAEVTFQAVVDPYARADVFLSASPDGLEVEEGFLTLTSLPGGLLAKVGKMKEQFGKANTMHAHTLPWVDVPIVMKNFLGGEEGLNDSGVSVSKLLMNPLFFLEATGELYQGNSGPFRPTSATTSRWLAACAGIETSLRQRISMSACRSRGPQRRRTGFTTRLFGVDATYRYRPPGVPFIGGSWPGPS